jgi:putative endonuclease
MKLKSYNFGLVGEYISILFYLAKFYIVLRHRFKTKFGEIDLICRKANCLVFVEVKSRSRDYDEVLCSEVQQKRMMRAAEFFLLKYPSYRSHDLRFDLVLIRPFSWPKLFKNFITV